MGQLPAAAALNHFAGSVVADEDLCEPNGFVYKICHVPWKKCRETVRMTETSELVSEETEKPFF